MWSYLFMQRMEILSNQNQQIGYSLFVVIEFLYWFCCNIEKLGAHVLDQMQCVQILHHSVLTVL